MTQVYSQDDQYAKYRRQTSFSSNVIVHTHTHTHTHIGPITEPGPSSGQQNDYTQETK